MSNRNLRKRVLCEARKWVGTPYVHQASVKGTGTDCLGLVRGIWRNLYGSEPQQIPNYSSDWGEASAYENLLEAANRWFEPLALSDARAGDLVVFRWNRAVVAKHLGILANRNGLIHAYERSGVVETVLGNHWRSRIAGTFQFPSLEKVKAQTWQQ